jgi:hypothetical protein
VPCDGFNTDNEPKVLSLMANLFIIDVTVEFIKADTEFSLQGIIPFRLSLVILFLPLSCTKLYNFNDIVSSKLSDLILSPLNEFRIWSDIKLTISSLDLVFNNDA